MKVKALKAMGIRLIASYCLQFGADGKPVTVNGTKQFRNGTIGTKEGPMIGLYFADADGKRYELELDGEKSKAVYATFDFMKQLLPAHQPGAELPPLTKEMVSPLLERDLFWTGKCWKMANAYTIEGVEL